MLDYREGTSVLASSALFLAGALTLIWLLGLKPPQAIACRSTSAANRPSSV